LTRVTLDPILTRDQPEGWNKYLCAMGLWLTKICWVKKLLIVVARSVSNEAIQPISMGANFNNYILCLITIVTRQPISELALRPGSWVAAPLVAARDDGKKAVIQ